MCCLIGLPDQLLFRGLSTYNTLPIFLVISHLLSCPVVATQHSNNGSGTTERLSNGKSNNSHIQSFTDYTRRDLPTQNTNATKQPNVTLSEALSSRRFFSSSTTHPSSKLSSWNRVHQKKNKAFETFYKVK